MSTEHSPAIVLVGDKPDLLIALRRLLQDLAGGHTIMAVAEGADALVQMAVRPVPLVITTYSMSGMMNGFQLIAAIKRSAPTTKVVLITEAPSAVMDHLAAKNNLDYHLDTPVSVERLSEIVREVLAPTP